MANQNVTIKGEITKRRFTKMSFFVAIVVGLFLSGVLGDDTQWEGRIVGGFAVKITDFPYQVSLQYNKRHICGGSIIGKRHIVTAGHCTDNASPEKYTVRVGSTYHAKQGKEIKVSKFVHHPSYNRNTINNDISIVVLQSDIEFTNSTKTVALANSSDTLKHGNMVTVTGWGRLTSSGSIPSELRAVQVPIVSKGECRKRYPAEKITDQMMCAGVGGKDACQGDSGGPLVHGKKLYGIVSWGYGCADAKYPGVYADVAKLRSFVDEAMIE